MSRRRKSLLAVLALICALILVYVTGSYYSSSTIPETPGIPDEESGIPGEEPDAPSDAPDKLSDATAETLEDTLETSSGSPTEPSDDERTFVIPEIPLGTMGAFSGLASSFGVFVLRKRAK